MNKVQFPCRSGKHNSNYRHGLSRHPLTPIYSAMIQRCHNSKNSRYKDYGARGIIVCDEWRSDKKAFFNWALSKGWEQGLSLDRINNDLGYNPDNCRLVNNIVQNRNKRNTVCVEYMGISKPLRDWCDELKLSFGMVYFRLWRKNMTPEQAFTTPSRYSKHLLRRGLTSGTVTSI